MLSSTPHESLVHHNLQVEIHPESGDLIAIDTIHLVEDTRVISFLLHADLSVALIDDAGTLTKGALLQGSVPIRQYQVHFSTPSQKVTLKYAGTIAHALSAEGESSSLRQSTPGKISIQGVFLSATSYWYPQVADALISFKMQVKLPDGWRSVSQGRSLPGHNGWEEQQPQEEIYLIAAPYHYYNMAEGSTLAEVYLRDNNPTLAKRYLLATFDYLSQYEKLIGPYPYTKFALVENFWESGYGMPSFTLLGPRVIQLPFIIHTSYPHEILHNWWGNGVYTDIASGNWSEGLTTYLSDHLIKEQQGEGAKYRRNTLQNYANYVRAQDDFPLIHFRGNQGQISQSIGYGKTLMLFHMLRNEIGDELFIRGLQQFYKNYKFRKAGFAQIRESFESVSGQSLKPFFEQWLTRTGAPTLKLSKVNIIQAENRTKLSITVEQTQSESPYWLKIPLFVVGEGLNQTERHTLEMKNRKTTWVIDTATSPVSVSIDPLFDLFRRPDPSEIPSNLGQLFGSQKIMAILPSNDPGELKQAYQALVTQWQQRQPGLTYLWDNQINALPQQGHLWIIGARNRFADHFSHLVTNSEITQGASSLALTQTNAVHPNQTLGYIHSDSIEAIGGLAKKLPHYGRYSYALFNGNQPQITQRGEWEVGDSALSQRIQKNYPGPMGQIRDHSPLTDYTQ
ncbi:M1 family metallopeptidase [Sedimenticola selenatireducens]|uniref:M1 family metallopeptidase n=1 Tax=Sedimenticola selenatireducens TaxID=191960 RepID=UPI0011864BE5|nr:M1 family aminopeptidase [Sedimenticola selenatireducens]TVT63442.1 MAG: M1 family metallopeptidase [Sedimenticola selenatireducens]